MRLCDQVGKAFKDAIGGEFEPALLHATITIDATAKRLYPGIKQVGERYRRCLRDYYWLLGPMVGAPINLVETRFSNVHLANTTEPDFADLLYAIFRCGHCHGDAVSASFSVTLSHGELSTWELAKDTVHMPDRIVWALLSVAVFSRVNAGETSSGDYYFTLGRDGPFYVSQWWGREEDFRPIAARYSEPRVTFEKLHRLREAADRKAARGSGSDSAE